MKGFVFVFALGWAWLVHAEETNRLARGDTPVVERVMRALSSWDARGQQLRFTDRTGRMTPVLVMEPLHSVSLRELFPNLTVFRLISSSDLIHYADVTSLLVDTNGAPNHLQSNREVAFFLGNLSRAVKSRDDALRVVRAFADLRSYKVVTQPPDFRDVRESEKQPPALENDFKFVAVEAEDEWRVYATLFTSEYSGSYERYVFTIYKPPGGGMVFEEPVLIRLRNYVF